MFRFSGIELAVNPFFFDKVTVLIKPVCQVA